MFPDRCMLCGRSYPTGLHILGCFLCFPCEKALLNPIYTQTLSPRKRRRLAQWARPAIADRSSLS